MGEFTKFAYIKTFGIPLLGILIPNATNLITNNAYPLSILLLHYLYFIFISWVVWQGNVWLMNLIHYKFGWFFNRYYKTIIALFLSNIVYTGAVSFLLLSVWSLFSHEPVQHPQAVGNTILLVITAACFIGNINEIAFLNQEKETTLSKVAQLNAAKIQAELEALKNQIDPHFIFNSLNTLSYLIAKDPRQASLFNDTLAKVYRYILGNKEKDLVFLKEEIEFVSNYFFLLKIRFGAGINMSIQLADLATEGWMIPPISIQMLVENVIKHNEFSDKKPVYINISVTTNSIIIVNTIHPKLYNDSSSGIGLKNLADRYKLITNRNITIENSSKQFVVKLPILKLQ